jgi:PhzF family phenazine biosynthesis protein
MAVPIYQVDSFTREPFRGNPAGVTIYEQARPDAWMAALAREMNLSETAFLMPEGDGYRLRWFTPAVEVTLCGHATLAAAHILWERRYLPADEPALFETLSGRLTCRLEGDWIVMDFPARPVSEQPAPAGLLEALGVERAVFTGRYKEDYLVEVADPATLRALQPDMARLIEVETRGVTVTARGEGEYDFVSRFFGPRVGVPEDPVTGSAHTALTPYWAAKLGKPELLAFQASARGGVLRVRDRGERVELLGQAVTVFAGELAEDAER